MSAIDLCRDLIDWEKAIVYSKPRISKVTGAKTIGIVLSNGDPFRVANTAPLRAWSPNIYEPDVNPKADCNLQFPDAEVANKQIETMKENLANLETKIRNDAVANSLGWFGKTLSAELVNDRFTEILRYKKNAATGEPDRTQAPTWRIKIPFYDGRFKCDLYDMDTNPIFKQKSQKEAPETYTEDINQISELIPNRTDIKIVALNGGIWFANGKFGTTWRLVQACVASNTKEIGGCFFTQQSPTDAVDSDDEAVVVPETEAAEAEAAPEPEAEPSEDKPTDVSLPKTKKVTKKK